MSLYDQYPPRLVVQETINDPTDPASVMAFNCRNPTHGRDVVAVKAAAVPEQATDYPTDGAVPLVGEAANLVLNKDYDAAWIDDDQNTVRISWASKVRARMGLLEATPLDAEVYSVPSSILAEFSLDEVEVSLP